MNEHKNSILKSLPGLKFSANKLVGPPIFNKRTIPYSWSIIKGTSPLLIVTAISIGSGEWLLGGKSG